MCLKNYLNVFQWDRFWIALKNNIVWLFLLVVPAVFLGLILAYLVNLSGKLSIVFRPIILLPMALSPVVIGTLWSWMYAPEDGAINVIFRFLRLNSLAKAWLADPKLAFMSIIVSSIWLFSGFAMIIYFAALRSIPPSMIESAEVDGASGLRILFHVIFPNLMRPTLIATAMLVIFCLKAIFPLVWTMTRGGPLNSTEVLPHLMYITAFERVEYGSGAVIGVVIFLLATAIIVPYARWFMRRWFR